MHGTKSETAPGSDCVEAERGSDRDAACHPYY